MPAKPCAAKPMGRSQGLTGRLQGGSFLRKVGPPKLRPTDPSAAPPFSKKAPFSGGESSGLSFAFPLCITAQNMSLIFCHYFFRSLLRNPLLCDNLLTDLVLPHKEGYHFHSILT